MLGHDGALSAFRKENGFAELLKLTLTKGGKTHPRLGLKVLTFVTDLAQLTGAPEDQLVSAGSVFHALVHSVVNNLNDENDLDQVEKRAFLLTVLGEVYGIRLGEEDGERLREWAARAETVVMERADEGEFVDTLRRLDKLKKVKREEL